MDKEQTLRAGSTEVLNPDVTPAAGSRQDIHTAFVIGLPRSGTTLLAFMLAGGEDVLSLSEPFLSLAARRHRLLNFLYFPAIQKHRISPPENCDDIGFFNYLMSFSRDCGFSSLIIKETYRLAPYLDNVVLLNRMADSGVPIITITRHPYDAATSTIRWARHQLRGGPGIMNRIMVPGFPHYLGDRKVVEWFAQNWVSFALWIKGRQLFSVRYEDLVRDPVKYMQDLCDRSNITFSERMLDNSHPRFFSGMSGDPGGKNKHKKPLNVRPVGKKEQLKPEFISYIRKICGRAAEELGYSL